MSADDQTTLRAIAPLVKLTFSTGQDDGLFHQFGASFKLNQAQIKALNSSSSQVPLNEIAVDFDVFNLLNSGTVLGKQYDARLTGATGFGQTLEIMNPRIARIGARFTF